MSELGLTDLQAFEAEVKQAIPGVEVRFKNGSAFMKVLGFLIYPFNPRFMDRYKTTIGKVVYFPSSEDYQGNPESSFQVLAHEFVHIWDRQQEGVWFSLSYLFPQILAVIPLLVFGVLAWPYSWLLALPLAGWVLGSSTAKLFAGKPSLELNPKGPLVAGWCVIGASMVATVFLSFFLLAWWKALVLLGGLACMAPWPAPWRVKWELRGYTMSIATIVWRLGRRPNMDFFVQQFTGPPYLFMSWRKARIEQALNEAVQAAEGNALQGRSPYRLVYQFLSNRGLLHA